MKPGFTEYFVGWAFPDTTERFFPTNAPIASRTAKLFRTALDVYQFTGNAAIFPAIQVSDDPQAWPAATVFTRVGTQTATGDGVTYSSGADSDMSATLQARYFREGFTVKGNAGNSVLQMVLVATAFTKRL